MDTKIINFIIDKGNVSEKVKSSTEWQLVKDYIDYPVTKPIVINELSKILTKLLTYKVSKEAHQRYSVRLHLIDNLRDWCRLQGDAGTILYFTDAKQSNIILTNLLEKYLTQDIIDGCDNTDDLIQLAEVLLNSVALSRSFVKSYKKVLDRIFTLDQNEKTENFFRLAIIRSIDLKLDLSCIEKIYISQTSTFIEKPFNECFIAYCTNPNKEEVLNKLSNILEIVTDSPALFKLVVDQLKKFFVSTEYAQMSQDFIKIILEKIQENCNNLKKDILNLYPEHLQFCVILLRIKRDLHTENTKNETIKALKEIFLKTNNDILILISHFPEWLPDYLKFYENLDLTSQKSAGITFEETFN